MRTLTLITVIAFGAHACAANLRIDFTFDGTVSPAIVNPVTLSGSGHFFFDDSFVTGSGLEFAAELALASLSLSSNTVGTTTFDTNNTFAIVRYNNGLIDAAMIHGQEGGGAINGGGIDDFRMIYISASPGNLSIPADELQIANFGILDDSTTDSPTGMANATYVVDPQPKRNLVLVTHGWRSSIATSELDGLQEAIHNHLSGDPRTSLATNYGVWSELDNGPPMPSALAGSGDVWDVVSFDWSDSSRTPTPLGATKNGVDLGHRLAIELRQNDLKYDHIHLIAHSAGAHVVDGMADFLKVLYPNATTHLTFLDAFTPSASAENLGNTATQSEHYIHGGGRIFDPLFGLTNATLPNAFNIDLTSLDPNIDFLRSHSFPPEWYDDTVRNPLLGAGLGFTTSQEYSGVFPHNFGFNKGERIDFQSRSIISETRLETTLNAVQFDPTRIGFSTTGNVTIVDANMAILETGSPVSLIMEIDVDRLANVLSFDYEFLSDAVGLLSVFWEDELLFIVHEAFSLDSVQDSELLWLGADYGPGVYNLTFLLEPQTAEQSVVAIANIQVGAVRAAPEPQSVAIWSLIGVGLVGFIVYRNRRKN